MPRTFFVRTFGCQMNEHDSRRIAADLAADGLVPAAALEDADVIVLNTCCIRENADNRLYGQLGHLKPLADARPDLQIAVGGCLAQKDREALLERAPHVDVVFGTHNVGHAPELLRRARASGSPVLEVLDAPVAGDDSDFPSAMAIRPGFAHSAWVTIQAGCDNSCAFCIVPAVRGPEQSRPFGELVAEVEALARAGTTEVTLLGQNVNSYGRDLTNRLRAAAAGPGPAGPGPAGADALLAGAVWAAGRRSARPLFADLLRAVGSVEGIRRVRFTSPHPKDLRPETIEAMAETPAVCEQLHLPLQSGSDAILKAMRRGYSAGRYLERLAAARAAIPDLAVTTDVIVGFPGETEDDFVATLEVVAEAGYDSAYTFVFSPRPGTRAAELTASFVPDEVVAERFARLAAVVERSALRAHQGRFGRLEEVVVEGPSKKDPALLTGRTRQGKLAHFAGPAGHEGIAPGSYATVEVTGAAPHHLRAELVALEAPVPVPAPAPVRRRIPVRSD